MKINTEYKNLKCPDCGSNEDKAFDIIIDFGEEIREIKFGCQKCYEMFIVTYDEVERVEEIPYS